MRRRVEGSRRKLKKWAKALGYTEEIKDHTSGTYISFLHQRTPCSCGMCSYYKYRKFRNSKRQEGSKKIIIEAIS